MRPRQAVERLSYQLNLPAEVTAGVPRLELIGNARLCLENHRGVGAFGTDYMELLVPGGAYCVRGSGLALLRMDHHALVVSGMICSIELQRI